MQTVELFLTSIRKEKAKAEQYVISGQILSFEDYQFNLGRIKGFNDAIDIYLDILKGMKYDH